MKYYKSSWSNMFIIKSSQCEKKRVQFQNTIAKSEMKTSSRLSLSQKAMFIDYKSQILDVDLTNERVKSLRYLYCLFVCFIT